PVPAWPTDWTSDAARGWYLSAFEGTGDEIGRAAAFLGEHAPASFVERLLEGFDLEERRELPVSFRQGNGYLGADDSGGVAPARHTGIYTDATLQLIGGLSQRNQDWLERTAEIERLDLVDPTPLRFEGEWFPNLEDLTLRNNTIPLYQRRVTCPVRRLTFFGPHSREIRLAHAIQELTFREAPKLQTLRVASPQLRELTITSAENLDTIVLPAELDREADGEGGSVDITLEGVGDTDVDDLIEWREEVLPGVSTAQHPADREGPAFSGSLLAGTRRVRESFYATLPGELADAPRDLPIPLDHYDLADDKPTWRTGSVQWPQRDFARMRYLPEEFHGFLTDGLTDPYDPAEQPLVDRPELGTGVEFVALGTEAPPARGEGRHWLEHVLFWIAQWQVGTRSAAGRYYAQGPFIQPVPSPRGVDEGWQLDDGD
ncbi:MAG: hypothetical protein ABEN55_08810, partial [Bradymonadaceae bacterium]